MYIYRHCAVFFAEFKCRLSYICYSCNLIKFVLNGMTSVGNYIVCCLKLGWKHRDIYKCLGQWTKKYTEKSFPLWNSCSQNVLFQLLTLHSTHPGSKLIITTDKHGYYQNLQSHSQVFLIHFFKNWITIGKAYKHTYIRITFIHWCPYILICHADSQYSWLLKQYTYLYK